MIRAKETTDLFELMDWCGEYLNSPRCTTLDPMRRFAIGFYQIYQGAIWGSSASADESKMAAFLHFMMVSVQLKLSIEDVLEKDILIEDYIVDMYRELLIETSKSQQMLVYHTDNVGVGRKSRYKPKVLTYSLGFSMRNCVRNVKRTNRKCAIHTAMEVMCGEL